MMIVANRSGEVGMPLAVERLQRGESALDAVEAAIRKVEADPAVRDVGRGGAPNLLGEMECDAAVMDGATLHAGAVGALQGYLHPVTVARRIMRDLPHVLLTGVGAAQFARETGQERAEMLTDEARADYQAWLSRQVPAPERARWPELPLAPYSWPSAAVRKNKDTVVFLAIDSKADIAAATSTSGWPYKYPGRLGDSPIVGAGFYAHNKYGACACTYTGEMTIRANTAAGVVRYMKAGASVIDACHEAVRDLREIGAGYIGPVVIHALDRRGEHYAVALMEKKSEVPCYWLWTGGEARVEARQPEYVAL